MPSVSRLQGRGSFSGFGRGDRRGNEGADMAPPVESGIRPRFVRGLSIGRARRSVPFARLMDALGVSRAQLKRDLVYMRERLNAPIEYDRDPNG